MILVLIIIRCIADLPIHITTNYESDCTFTLFLAITCSKFPYSLLIYCLETVSSCLITSTYLPSARMRASHNIDLNIIGGRDSFVLAKSKIKKLALSLKGFW